MNYLKDLEPELFNSVAGIQQLTGYVIGIFHTHEDGYEGKKIIRQVNHLATEKGLSPIEAFILLFKEDVLCYKMKIPNPEMVKVNINSLDEHYHQVAAQFAENKDPVFVNLRRFLSVFGNTTTRLH